MRATLAPAPGLTAGIFKGRTITQT